MRKVSSMAAGSALAQWNGSRGSAGECAPCLQRRHFVFCRKVYNLLSNSVFFGTTSWMNWEICSGFDCFGDFAQDQLQFSYQRLRKSQLLAVGPVTSSCFGIWKRCHQLQCGYQCLWECTEMAAGHRPLQWTSNATSGNQPYPVQCGLECLWESRWMEACTPPLQWSEGKLPGTKCSDLHSCHMCIWKKQAMATCSWSLSRYEDLHIETKCCDLRCSTFGCCIHDKLRVLENPEIVGGARRDFDLSYATAKKDFAGSFKRYHIDTIEIQYCIDTI